MQIVSQIIKQSLVNWKSLKWLQSSKLKDIGDHGITKLKNSLKENNFVQPFNVWEDSKGVIWILDGHHREKALTQLEQEGYEIPETLPANFIECKDKKEAAKMVLLYSSIYAKITNDGLGEFLDDFDLDLSNLVNEIDLPGLDFDTILEPETLPEDIDEAPQPLEKTYSILGDIFEIDGKHRVMCGDSTKESDVSILMNGNKADMVFTDPPYGMFLDTDYSQINPQSEKAKKFQSDRKTVLSSKNYDKVIGDNEDFNPDFITMIFKLFSSVKEIFIWGADYFAEYLENKNNGSWVVWDKRSNEDGSNLDAMFGSMFELCWSKEKHKREIARIRYAGPFGTEREDIKKRLHPTQKPINLAKWFFEKWGNENDLITDLFLGSGSTLIAAETTKRICYGMEIDQHYSDVILRRYKKTFPNAQFKCLTRNDFPFEELFNA